MNSAPFRSKSPQVFIVPLGNRKHLSVINTNISHYGINGDESFLNQSMCVKARRSSNKSVTSHSKGDKKSLLNTSANREVERKGLQQEGQTSEINILNQSQLHSKSIPKNPLSAYRLNNSSNDKENIKIDSVFSQFTPIQNKTYQRNMSRYYPKSVESKEPLLHTENSCSAPSEEEKRQLQTLISYQMKPPRSNKSSIGKYLEIDSSSIMMEKALRSQTHSALQVATPSTRYSSLRQTTRSSQRSRRNLSTASGARAQIPKVEPKKEKDASWEKIPVLNQPNQQHEGLKPTKSNDLKVISLLCAYDRESMKNVVINKKQFKQFLKTLKLKEASEEQLMVKYMYEYFQQWQNKMCVSLTTLHNWLYNTDYSEDKQIEFENLLKKKQNRAKTIRKCIGVLIEYNKVERDVKRLNQISFVCWHYETIILKIQSLHSCRLNLIKCITSIKNHLLLKSSFRDQSQGREKIENLLDTHLEPLRLQIIKLNKGNKSEISPPFILCDQLLKQFENFIQEGMNHSNEHTILIDLLHSFSEELAKFVKESIILQKEVPKVSEGLPLFSLASQEQSEREKDSLKEQIDFMIHLMENTIHLNSKEEDYQKIEEFTEQLRDRAKKNHSDSKGQDWKSFFKNIEELTSDAYSKIILLREIQQRISLFVKENSGKLTENDNFKGIREITDNCLEYKSKYLHIHSILIKLVNQDDKFPDDPIPKRKKKIQTNLKRIDKDKESEGIKGIALIEKQIEEIEELSNINKWFQCNVQDVEQSTIFYDPATILTNYTMDEAGKNKFLNDITIGVSRLLELKENTEEAINLSGSQNLSNVIQNIKLFSEKYAEMADIAFIAAQICNFPNNKKYQSLNTDKSMTGQSALNNERNLKVQEILEKQFKQIDLNEDSIHTVEQKQNSEESADNSTILQNPEDERQIVEILKKLKQMKVRKSQMLSKNSWFEKFTKHFLNGLLLFDLRLSEYPLLISQMDALIFKHQEISSFQAIKLRIEDKIKALRKNGYLCEIGIAPYIEKALKFIDERANFATKVFGTSHAILPNGQLLCRISELFFESLLHFKQGDKIVDQLEKLYIFLLKGTDIVRAEAALLSQLPFLKEVQGITTDEKNESKLGDMSQTFGMLQEAQNVPFKNIIQESLLLGNLLQSFVLAYKQRKEPLTLKMYEELIQTIAQYLQVKRDQVSVFKNDSGQVKHIQSSSQDGEFSLYQEKIQFIQKHLFPQTKCAGKDQIAHYSKQIEQLSYKSGPVCFKYHFKSFHSHIDFQIESPCSNLFVQLSLENDPNTIVFSRKLENQRISATFPICDIFSRMQMTLVAEDSIEKSNEKFLRHKSTYGFLMRAQRTTSLKISHLNHYLRSEESFKIFFHLKKQKAEDASKIEIVVKTDGVEIENNTEKQNPVVFLSENNQNQNIQEWTVISPPAEEMTGYSKIDFYAKIGNVESGIFYIYDKNNSYTICSQYLLNKQEIIQKVETPHTSNDKENVRKSVEEYMKGQLWHAFSILNCSKLVEQQKLSGLGFQANKNEIN